MLFRSRKSLDCSRQGLRISIDLGKREEESETWLQVGRIYYLIHEDELADMYLQVRGAGLGGRGREEGYWEGFFGGISDSEEEEDRQGRPRKEEREAKSELEGEKERKKERKRELVGD